MTALEPVQTPEVPVSPALFMGAASPLWGYFGAMAAGGVAYWWMTRWTRPMNLETMFESLAEPVLPQVLAAPLVEATLKTATEILPTVEADVAVGGEAAPIAAMQALAPASQLDAEPEPMQQAAPEPESIPSEASAAEAAPAPPPTDEPKPPVATAKASAEPSQAPKPKAKKSGPDTSR